MGSYGSNVTAGTRSPPPDMQSMHSYQSTMSFNPNLRIPEPLAPRSMNSSSGYQNFSRAPPQNDMIQLQNRNTMRW
jgi:hypothetical protein